MHFVMYAFSNHAMVLHNVTPIDFDARSVPSDHNIQISYKVTPLVLLQQVAVSLGDNRRFHLTGWLQRFCTKSRRLCYCNKRRFYFSTVPHVRPNALFLQK